MPLLVAGLYFLVSKKYRSANDSVSTSTTNISEWVVYDNKEYGYRFRYPKNLEVIGGTSPKYALYDLPEAVFIEFSAKYPNIKSSHPYDQETFLNYEINITRSASSTQHTSERGDIRVYRDEQGNVFTFVLEGMNPEHTYATDWLEGIGNQQLTEWVNEYPEYLKILDGIYNSFEVYKK